LLHTLTKRFDGLDHGSQFVMPPNACFQLAHVFAKRLEALFQFLPSPLVLLQFEHLS
jgi:hypothetical protein